MNSVTIICNSRSCIACVTTASGSRFFFARCLEHLLSVQGVLGSNRGRRCSFSAVPYLSLLRLSCRKMGTRPV